MYRHLSGKDTIIEKPAKKGDKCRKNYRFWNTGTRMTWIGWIYTDTFKDIPLMNNN